MLAALRRWSRRRLPNWMRGSLEPDEYIGVHRMRRWWLLPYTRCFGLYLHHTTVSDERLLHDHPGWNVSFRLAGELYESVPGSTGNPAAPRAFGPEAVLGDTGVEFDRLGNAVTITRRLGRFTFRRACSPHRLVIPDGSSGAWTIWLRGQHRRKWGFYTPHGWVPWREGLAYMQAEDEARERALAQADHA